MLRGSTLHKRKNSTANHPPQGLCTLPEDAAPPVLSAELCTEALQGPFKGMKGYIGGI